MRFHTHLVLMVAISLFMFAQTASATAVSDCNAFTRNLKLGMKGDDVKMLQVFLNANPVSRVAVSGPGSLGNETTYFGQLTQRAVVQLQELYASEVLIPVGLTKGSGFVGSQTRAKMKAICLAQVKTASTVTRKERVDSPIVPVQPIIRPTETLASPVTPTAPIIVAGTISSLPESPFQSETPVIMYTSANTAIHGDAMNVSGLGFTTTENVVHIGELLIPNIVPSVPGTLNFTIPNSVLEGQYDLWVTNSKGESNKVLLVIVDPNATPPTITEFTPKEGFQGTMVTITGTGFTPTGNQIRTSGGNIDNVSSPDGKTLQFIVALPIPELQPGQDLGKNVRDPFGFSVVNKNGISEQKVFYFKV